MNFLIIAWNLIRRTIGHPKGVAVHLILPVAVVSGIIGLMGIEADAPTTVAVSNADTGSAGVYLIRAVSQGTGLIVMEAPGEAAVQESVRQRQAAAGFAVPPGFTDSLRSGQPLPVELFEPAEGAVPEALRIRLDAAAAGAVETALRLQVAGLPASLLGSALEQSERPAVGAARMESGERVNHVLPVATGFTLMFLIGLMNSAVGIMLEDRQQRTMTRMFAAPVRAYELTAGQAAGCFAIGLLQIGAVLAVTTYVLGFSYGVPAGAHVLVLAAFLLPVLGIAGTVAGAVRDPEHLSAMNAVIATPTCMLGGCLWPVDAMPAWMQKLSYFVPQRWAIDAIERLAAGAPVAGIGLHLTVMLLFAAVLLSVGSVIFTPREAVRRW